MISKVFGKNPSGEHLKRINQSPNYRNGSFQNVEPTEVMLKSASMVKMLIAFFNKPQDVVPQQAIPIVISDLHKYNEVPPRITWFGHSSYLIQSNGFNILVDPVFGGHASPFSFMVKSFEGTDRFPVKDFPVIDLLIITHDHYDHLDYATVLKLQEKVKHIITPLGVGSHLVYWGYDKNKITELDWWEQYDVEPGISLTATPARHFSGRGLKRGQTLWASFVLAVNGYKLFLGSDSGYDAQFKSIGKLYGPFDLALLDCGQYGDNWPFIHMKPEETAAAATDLGAKATQPVHWGKFALSYHSWKDPIQRFISAASHHQYNVHTPRIGEGYIPGTGSATKKWWENN